MSSERLRDVLARERNVVGIVRTNIDALIVERNGMTGKFTTVNWDLVQKLLSQLLKSLDIAAGYERFLFTDRADEIPQNLQADAGKHATELLFLYKHLATLAEAVRNRASAEQVERFLEHEKLIEHIANEFERLEPHLKSLQAELESHSQARQAA